MSLGRSLFITFALLAYLGQALAYVQPACEGVGDTAVTMQHSMASDSEHMHHDMGADQALAAHDDDCCDKQYHCVGQGCHSPVPAIAATGNTQFFAVAPHNEQQHLRTISFPFYFYKPPIFS